VDKAGLDADAQHEFIGSDSEGLVDLAIQFALREAAIAGEFGGAEDAAGVLLGVADDQRNFAAKPMAVAAFVAAEEFNPHVLDTANAFLKSPIIREGANYRVSDALGLGIEWNEWFASLTSHNSK